MDTITDSDSVDMGSIPVRDGKKAVEILEIPPPEFFYLLHIISYLSIPNYTRRLRIGYIY